MPSFVEIAVFRPLEGTFTYILEDSSPRLGSIVDIPFGRGKSRGVILGKADGNLDKDIKIKSVSFVYPSAFDLPVDLIELGKWMADYYVCPLGEVLSALTPPLLKREPAVLESKTECLRAGLELHPGQLEAHRQIQKADKRRPIYLHGITGSGKTELFMREIEECLAGGKSCIYLVPEITLTHETRKKLEARFSPILVFHSGMSPKERRESWLKSKSRGPHLVVGARSSLFAPVSDLGLIVVDEEHDPSYKQDSTPRYHGRDVSVVRAMKSKAAILLGSATPSMESFSNAQKGKYTLVSLRKRISPHPMPEVHVVDLTQEREKLKRKGAVLLSSRLIDSVRKTVSDGRQAILFLNRRGFSTAIICASCGEKLECPDCSVAYTYYKRAHLAICHHCGREQDPPRQCPRCSADALMYRGTGTERMEEMVERCFQDLRIVRVDGSKDAEEDGAEKLARFMKGDADLLLGTQMISKGLDSPNIRLSAALNADLGLAMPDFRAAERVFQLLTQLAGRSGRGGEAGECIIQTSRPKHYAIRHCLTHDYVSFFEEELQIRQDFSYPPFVQMARIVASCNSEEKLKEGMIQVASLLRDCADSLSVTLMGPAPAPLQKIKKRFRIHLIMKCPSPSRMTAFLREAMKVLRQYKHFDSYLDRDPQNMM